MDARRLRDSARALFAAIADAATDPVIVVAASQRIMEIDAASGRPRTPDDEPA